MINLFKKISISLLLILFFSSCFTDVEEKIELHSLNIESLESMVQDIDFNLYDTIPHLKEFPIIGWRGIQSHNYTIERFIELRNSGINIALARFANVDSVLKALDIAEQVGLKIIINTP